ncbi:MAG: cell division protein FtsB [Burkholderiaceae bacterium]|nr:MAG: cell division protein FtsB [Burkholderiaceae bacterium]
MRLITLILLALVILIQFPLWLGKGGWLRVSELDKQVDVAHNKNEELRQRNAKLESEVEDLKNGTEAVEERARFELGMVKKDEIFVQILEPGSKVDAKSQVQAKKTTSAN